MDPIEFLTLAKELNAGTTQSPAVETKIRTAISRAYYFIFLKIKISLEALGAKFIRGKDSHQQIIDCLYRDQSTAGVAQKLGSLRSKRNEADYELHLAGFNYGSKKAELAIGEAESLNRDYDLIDKTIISKKINAVGDK